MKTRKCLGIWMDHSNAHLIEFTTDPMQTKMIVSGFTHEAKVDSLEKSEKLMHHKQQGSQLAFFKMIEKEIEKNTEVLLFGPTDAKNELLTLLRANHKYDHILIEMKQTDKMTENQLFEYVRNHFSVHHLMN
jgi:hypothetical protein